MSFRRKFCGFSTKIPELIFLDFYTLEYNIGRDDFFTQKGYHHEDGNGAGFQHGEGVLPEGNGGGIQEMAADHLKAHDGFEQTDPVVFLRFWHGDNLSVSILPFQKRLWLSV